MESYGHNIGSQFVTLYMHAETLHMQKADRYNDQSEAWIEQVENIHKLVAAMQNKRDPKTGKVDLSQDNQLKALVDLVASYNDQLIPKNIYSWSKDSFNSLKETLGVYVNELSSKISHKTLELQYTLQRLFEMLQITRQTMREDSAHKSNLVRNLNGGRV